MKTCLPDALFDAFLDEPKVCEGPLNGFMNRQLNTLIQEGITPYFECGQSTSMCNTTVPYETRNKVLNNIEADLFSLNNKPHQSLGDVTITSYLSSALEPTPIKPGLLLRPEQPSGVVNCNDPDSVLCTFVDYSGTQNPDNQTGKKRRSSLATDPGGNKRSRKASTKRRGLQEPNFRPYQHHKFQEKYEALLEFKEKYGHCCVPHTFNEDPALSRWVQRQRYQYKLKAAGNSESTMTQERIAKLEAIGFVWDSHKIAWEDHLQQLKEYKQEHGDCNVPSTYVKNPALGAWVKYQRRQYRRFFNGESFHITFERIASLDALGFDWKQRKGFV